MEGHIPVLFNECLEYLNLKDGTLIVDGTLGGGGHSLGILKNANTRLIGIDKDTDAIARCKERLKNYGDRVTFVHDDYKNIKQVLENLGIQRIDGALLDLGVSSYQLDIADRGFSYGKDAPLDMRMDKTSDFSAHDVVNGYSAEKLAKVLFEYGEEKFARRIAERICERRKILPIATTTELAEIIKDAIPAAARRTGPHPARRSFQAIRIEVNGELENLGKAVSDFIDVLKPGGRLCIITFHSLEDRIVKNEMKNAQDPCTCPKDFPVCICGKVSKGKVITRKPIVPADAETSENIRARSAKLRVFEKI